jgi:hypothetical protein
VPAPTMYGGACDSDEPRLSSLAGSEARGGERVMVHSWALSVDDRLVARVDRHALSSALGSATRNASGTP